MDKTNETYYPMNKKVLLWPNSNFWVFSQTSTYNLCQSRFYKSNAGADLSGVLNTTVCLVYWSLNRVRFDKRREAHTRKCPGWAKTTLYNLQEFFLLDCEALHEYKWAGVKTFQADMHCYCKHQHALARIWTCNVTAVRRLPKPQGHEWKFSRAL